MALSGPAHYVKAGQLLAGIEANPALSSETGTSLATRAIAHAALAARPPSRWVRRDPAAGYGRRPRGQRSTTLLQPELSPLQTPRRG